MAIRTPAFPDIRAIRTVLSATILALEDVDLPQVVVAREAGGTDNDLAVAIPVPRRRRLTPSLWIFRLLSAHQPFRRSLARLVKRSTVEQPSTQSR